MAIQFKRALALLLAMLLSVSLCMQGAYAAEATEPDDGEQTLEAVPDAAEGQEAEQADPADPAAEAPAGDEPAPASDAAGENAAQPEAGPAQDGQAQAPLVNYAVVMKPVLTASDTQEVLVGVGSEDTVLDAAVLTLRSEDTGASFDVAASGLPAGAALFRIDGSLTQTGTYRLDALRYTFAGVEIQVSFAEIGIEAAYGVNTAAETEPDAVVVPEDAEGVSMEVSALDEAGNLTPMDSIEDALSAAEAGGGSFARNGASAFAAGDSSGTVVVVLDPGHDATHHGATGTTNGVTYREEDYNLKIAQYCKQALEKYAGVTVYMTREGSACPNILAGETSKNVDATLCNQRRVEYAQKVGANYYVSIHLNSAEVATAEGAEVYYPNENYNSELSAAGEELAQEILDQLVALGLADRGVKIRNSEDNTRYPDGTLADFYGVIRRCKEAGICGIIVEHAFMTNSEDFDQFLSDDAKLRQLGEADAAGIAAYLGLSEQIKITGSAAVKTTDSLTGSFRATLTVDHPEAVRTVRAAVWSAKGGQDDIVWTTATRSGSSWYVDVNTRDHGYDEGTYYVHFYVTDVTGHESLTATATPAVSLDRSQEKVEAQWNPSEGTIEIKLNSPFSAANVSGVRFAVWSSVDGQDDLRWYDAAQNSDGTWSGTVRLSDHTGTGTYFVHCYGNTSGGLRLLNDTSVSVAALEAEMTARVTDQLSGSFRVTADVNVPEAVRTVRAAVWSAKDGQDDIVWTTATRSGGSWYVDVNTRDHGYDEGTYYVHFYVTDVTGRQSFLGSINQTVAIDKSQEKLEAQWNPAEGTIEIKLNSPFTAAGMSDIRFAVWSLADGQDDLRWYTAQQNSDGTWSRTVRLSDHSGAGAYAVHCYGSSRSGLSFLNSAAVTVAALEAEVSARVTDQVTGSFRVTADVNVPEAVRTVRAAVWSAKDGQDDIVWTTATRSGGSWYVDVNTRDHGYDEGTYYVHFYVTDVTGRQSFLGSINQTVAIDKSQEKLEAQWNPSEGTLEVKLNCPFTAADAAGVRFAVWSSVNGQDDLRWYDATRNSDGTWSRTVRLSDHSGTGTYIVHCYGNTGAGLRLLKDTSVVVAEAKTAISVRMTGSVPNVFQLTLTPDVPETVQEMNVAVWTTANGQDDLRWTTAQKSGGSWYVDVDRADHNGETGNYAIHVYVRDFSGNYYFSASTDYEGYTSIMGVNSVTVSQMAAFYRGKNRSFPAIYDMTLEEFCQIYYEECEAEGIDVAVAFAQAMNETGWLSYGGQVKASQFNFAGIKTSDGKAFATFSTVREGIQAHVQHLKAYASKEALKNPCVDPRFHLVTRGCAPYVEWLGVQENPDGRGWAEEKGYGGRILRMMNELYRY